jgi:hypothetical protein
MKKFLKVSCILALVSVICCGCGTLTRKFPNDTLRKDDILYAETLPHWPNYDEMTIEIDDVDYSTDKSASKVMPIIPVLYWTTVGSFENDTFFASRKVMSLIPVFYVCRENAFKKTGERFFDDFTFNLACVFWFNSVKSSKEDIWRTGIVWLPGVGPCIGFGSGYFQFLWIPLSDM